MKMNYGTLGVIFAFIAIIAISFNENDQKRLLFTVLGVLVGLFGLYAQHQQFRVESKQE